MDIIWVIVIVIAAILLLGAVGISWWIISMHNLLQGQRANAEEALGVLSSSLNKRYADISAVLEITKGEVSKEVSAKVLELKDSAMASSTIDEQFEIEARLEKQLVLLYKEFEEKKASFSEDKLELIKELEASQKSVDHNRQFYNGIASTYNLRLAVFPGNMVKRACKFNRMPNFYLED